MHKLSILLSLALAATPLYAGMASAGGEYVLRVEEKPPPDEIAAELREQIVPKAYQLSDADGLFFELWFVEELAVSKIGDTPKDTLKQGTEIALLGAAVVHAEDHNDFRDDPIDPGIYVLRMSLQPQDGNHMGTSPFDTFAILMPYDKDGELAEFADHEFMVELASEDTIAEHPPILALQPMPNADGEFPRLDENEEEAWHYLSLKFTAKSETGNAPLPVYLVFEGIGDIE